MPNYARIELIGHATRDPQRIGDSAVAFSVAVNHRTVNRATGEASQDVTYFDCLCYGKLADIAERYINKGDAVHVGGDLKPKHWTAKDGTERSGWQVYASGITLLGNTRDNEDRGTPPPKPQAKPTPKRAPEPEPDDDEIPF